MLQRRRHQLHKRVLTCLALMAAIATGWWFATSRSSDDHDTFSARSALVDGSEDRSDPSSWAHDVSAGARVSTVDIRTTDGTAVVAVAVAIHHGHLLTSSRALGDGASFVVLLEGGTSIGASLVGRDPATDIAVLSFDGTLSPAEITTEPVRAGDPVAVVGPGGRARADTVASPATVASTGDGDTLVGVVSLTKPAGLEAGGPVVDAEGAVVGIVAATAPDAAAAVVPVAVATRIAEQLIADGAATHAWLGVRVVDADGRIVVEAVDPAGPAASAGVRSGDLIITLGGVGVDQSAALIARLWTYRPGTWVTVGVERDGEVAEHELELGSAPAD